MKKQRSKAGRANSEEDSSSELLVLPDGRIFAHNISPVLAEVLAWLDPSDAAMQKRARQNKSNPS